MIEPNNIYLGDCYELIKQIPDKSIDLIMTDPPYEITSKRSKKSVSGGVERAMKYMTRLSNADISDGFDYALLDEMCRVLKNIYIYIWCSRKQLLPLMKYFIEDKGCLFDVLIWHKKTCMPLYNGMYLKDHEYCLLFRESGTDLHPKSYEYARGVFHTVANADENGKYQHPTVKPLWIVKRLIENSTKEGDVVLDCFAGSGTTLKACQELNRQYIGFEINPKYYEIAKDRLNNINAKGEVSLF